MARPKKKNADYFPHDADMRNDPKVKALRRKFGFTGYAVWGMLLEILTDSDFFEYPWTALNNELLAGDFDIEPDLLEEIVTYCLKVKLLEKDQDLIFTKKLKERFEGLLAKRTDDRKRKSKEFSDVKTPKEPVIHSENTQSKVKESKAKESKVIIDNEKFVKIAKDSEQWLESISMNRSVSVDAVKVFISQFERHLIGIELQKPNLKDFKSHFVYWFDKQSVANLIDKPTGRSNQISYAD